MLEGVQGFQIFSFILEVNSLVRPIRDSWPGLSENAAYSKGKGSIAYLQYCLTKHYESLCKL